jgi:uncharacterized membrane protein YeaQ/YmgE (transglycosylase-associated protein family)
MLNVLGWLVVGALIGWLSSLGLSPGHSRRLNLVVSILGAVLGGLWFSLADFSALLSSNPTVNLSSLFIACIGAISVLTITNVARQGRAQAPDVADATPEPYESAPPANPAP